MIFSRLRENLKRQDWFTVSIELATVVFGVFLALQADNWNEWRKERIAEERFLNRLHAAFVDSNELAVIVIDYMKGHARMADVVLDGLDACAVGESDRYDFANGIYQLGQAVPPNIPEGVFGELRNTNRADIIRSDTIRDTISMVMTGYDYYMGFHNDIVAQITPVVAYVNQHVAYKIDPDQGAKQFIDWEDMTLDIASVCRDPKFKAAVSTAQRQIYEIIGWHQQALRRHETLVDVLATELEIAN